MNLPTVILVTGRVGLASLFLLGGLNKILNYNPTLSNMREAGLEPAVFLLPLVIALELVGGSLVAIGNRMAGMAALLLAGFTIATNVAFHDFWTMEGERAALELSLFFKNISIAGALIFVAGTMLTEKSRS
ncbi:MAG: DoxX family protein [Pseudomonadota bacterium]